LDVQQKITAGMVWKIGFERDKWQRCIEKGSFGGSSLIRVNSKR
jgi:hypothetical protein